METPELKNGIIGPLLVVWDIKIPRLGRISPWSHNSVQGSAPHLQSTTKNLSRSYADIF